MKVYCFPVRLPNAEKHPSQAEAAKGFIDTLEGLVAVAPHESGTVTLCFKDIGAARVAKWKFEEFCPMKLPLMEGTLSNDKHVLNLNKVIKGE